MWKPIAVVWTLPNTLIGLVAGGMGLCCGGGVQMREGCLEFYGGPVDWLLGKWNVFAMTLGHTILCRKREGLDIVRRHEQVHVHQFERWGPFFLPAYLGCSAWLWLTGKDFYRGNPFEVEAYDIDDPATRRTVRGDDTDDDVVL